MLPEVKTIEIKGKKLTEEVIRIRGLKKAFGSNIVLDDFNLDLFKTEDLAVLGRSGSGKYL